MRITPRIMSCFVVLSVAGGAAAFAQERVDGRGRPQAADADPKTVEIGVVEMAAARRLSATGQGRLERAPDGSVWIGVALDASQTIGEMPVAYRVLRFVPRSAQDTAWLDAEQTGRFEVVHDPAGRTSSVRLDGKALFEFSVEPREDQPQRLSTSENGAIRIESALEISATSFSPDVVQA